MTEIILTLSLILAMANTAIEPVRISEWRGPDRSGIYNEENLLKYWPENGPAEIYSVNDIGNGFVSPVFQDSSFYISGEIDSMVFLQSYDLKGIKRWQTLLGREWTKSYRGSRSHPTIVGDLIYIGSGLGDLYCVEKNTGKIIWSKSLEKDLGGITPFHGHSEAPVVEGDNVFWTAGGKVNNVVDLNRFTGDIIWSASGFGEPSGYNSPKLIRLHSVSILVTFSSYHMMGFDIKTGEMLWSHEQDNTPLAKRTPGIGDTHSNTVLYDNGSIYYAEGDGNCGVRLDLSADGKSIKEAWRNTGFDSFMGGILKIGNFLYGCGTAHPGLYSVNATTGMTTDSLTLGSGALISADNMLYFYSQKGDLSLISQKDGDIEKVSSFRITKGTGQHFSHPVVYRGVLYQRHGNVLTAYDIKNKTNGNY